MSILLSLRLNALVRRTPDLRAELESEKSQGAAEEMGIASIERPEGGLVWFHAPNVNKALALIKLIRQLSEDWTSVNFLLTTPRSGSVPFSTDALPARCIHQFSPAEAPDFIEAFLAFWKPGIAVFSGADLGPATVLCVSNARIPTYLLDVKLNRGAFAGLSDRLLGNRAIMREILRRFDYIDTVDASSARALASIGILHNRIRISGPLEEVSATLTCNESDRSELTKILAGRPVWLASNVPHEEDDLVLAAHMVASRTAHKLLLILVPNVPQRGPEIAASFSNQGIRTRVRSLGELPDKETQVYIADTEGERGLWYRLATVSYLGSSLAVGHSVHAPFEAAGLGSAIIHGPNLGSHRSAFEALDNESGAKLVRDVASLSTGLVTLLAPDQSAAMAHSAWDLTTKGARATDLALKRLETMLQEIGAY